MSEDNDHCELGQKAFWDNAYERELSNLELNGDEGEVWFGAEVMHTMVSWLDTVLTEQSGGTRSISILDVGTGNALLPLELAKLGYIDLTGSDYSPQSIALSQHILRRHKQTQIRLVVDDLLQTCLQSRFDVITDKGTLDAIGLMTDAEINRARYQQSVWSLLNPGGLLVITSCNSTQEELSSEFGQSTHGSLAAITSHSTQQSQPQQGDMISQQGNLFQYSNHVKTYPKFKFAGVEGTKVCTVAFKKGP